MSEALQIVEVGLRDGLQDEHTQVTTEGKVRLFSALVEAGLGRFEVTSFVNPRAVPQMADADALYPELARFSRTERHALVINEKGYERARAAGVSAIAVPLVASDTLSQRNSRMSVEDATAVTCRLIERAQADGVASRAYVAVAWVCPFEGATDPARVERLARRVFEAGVGEVVLADTIGHAHPLEVGRLCERIGRVTDMRRLAVHLHDTTALGLANASAAMAAGVRIFDASVGGLGGCPFAPGAAGNLATEDLVFMAEKMGFSTGVDLATLWRAVGIAGSLVGRALGGRTRAWWEGRTERRAES